MSRLAVFRHYAGRSGFLQEREEPPEEPPTEDQPETAK